MRNLIFPIVATALVLLSGCDAAVKQDAAATTAVAPTKAEQIAWRDGDVEEAFAEATEAGKPVLLYWGAVWCPPCNVLKTTLFHDAEFVARTRDFVPVYLDGDSDGAQRWGEHFAIRGYPTLIILRPDQTEITRLSGGGDANEISQALRAVQGGKATAADIVARAQADPQHVTADEWALIAAYGWEVDLNRLVAADQKAKVLKRLAEAAPNEVLQRRFSLLAFEDEATADTPAPGAKRQDELIALLGKVLADAQEVKRNRSTLVYNGADLIRFAGGSPSENEELQQALVKSLDSLQADESVSIDGRLSLVNADIAVHHLKAGKDAPAPKALLEKVQQRAAWADSAAKTPYERQAVISDAADLLEQVGDLDGAERMLIAELKRSTTPFYYMPDLAEIAEKRGDVPKAIDWWRQGYETSTGTASRIQWGVLYIQSIIRLTPEDSAALEAATTRVIDELGQYPDSYHQRTRVRFEGLEANLTDWSKANHGAKVLKRLQSHMHLVCPTKQTDDASRSACGAWLSKV